MPLLCRVAENMFWLNRYVERAISIIRVVDVTAHLELDSGDPDANGIDYWTPLLGPAIDSVAHDGEDESPAPLPHDVRYYLAFDPDNPSSLVSCVRQARSAAREVRDSISSEMWERINTSYLMLAEPGQVRDLEDDLHAFYRRVRDSLILIQGLADATVAHDESWQFLSLGNTSSAPTTSRDCCACTAGCSPADPRHAATRRCAGWQCSARLVPPKPTRVIT